jgi:hypothetical protein
MTRIQDLLIRPNRVLFNVSVYLNGRWFFDSLQNPVKTYEGQNYYRMNYPFGLIYEDVADPSKINVRGNAGDYVTENADGSLGILSNAMYKQMFSDRNPYQEAPPPTSNLLRNANYLTNVLRGSSTPSYNTTVQRASPSRTPANSTPTTTTPAQTKPCNCN